MGETAFVNGVTITEIANRVGEQARVSLISQQPKEAAIVDYGLFGIYAGRKLSVTDETGKSYEAEPIRGITSPARDFFFPLNGDGSHDYTLTIPEIDVGYEEKATIEIPTETVNNLNQTFEIAGFPVTITRTERVNDKELGFYLDLHYDEHADKFLHSISIDMTSQMAKLNDRTGQVEYMQFPIETRSPKIKVTITKPQVVLRGPWTFRFPADKYFAKP